MSDLTDLSLTPWRRVVLCARDDIWCLVDAIDFEFLSANSWNVWHDGRNKWQLYAKRNTGPGRDTVRMHREVLLRADPDGYFADAFADHINGCTLDNRRANLRWVTEAQNRGNRRARGMSPSVENVLRDLLEALAPVTPEAIPF